MSLSWRIGTISGIPVRLHFTMVLIPILLYDRRALDSPLAFAVQTGLVALLFGSVLLHELGHALTARRFGVRTLDIVLTPIGGMARILNMPERPRHEIAIALAGPAVSLVISGAAMLAALALALSPFVPFLVTDGLVYLAGINLLLGLFNLVPALPMDGGRVLRGYLALKRSHLEATRLAARIGRILAVAGGVAGALWLHSWSIVLIAVFVYLAAGNEERMAVLREMQRQEAASGGSWPGVGGVRVWLWSWPNRPHRATGGLGADGHAVGSDGTREREVLIVEGGRAEVISRRDPDRG